MLHINLNKKNRVEKMAASELGLAADASAEADVPRWLSRKVWALILLAFMAVFHIYMGATAPLPSMQQVGS